MAGHSRALRLAAAAALAAAVHAPAAHAQSPTVTPPRARLSIPREIGGFALRGRHDYEDKSLGITLRYMSPADSLVADAYFYPGPGFDAGCDAACASIVMGREVEEFKTGLSESVRRGYIRSADVTADSALRAPSGAAWLLGHHVRLHVADSTNTRDQSDYVLYYLPGYRVKIRASYRATPARVAALHAFMGALVPAVTAPPPAAP